MLLNNTEIEFDGDLAKIVSYITFDGHLAEDLKCFYLCSKDKEMLFDFEKLILKKFKVSGRFEKRIGIGESYKYRVFNREICKFLEKAGAPRGNKTAKIFSIPAWIKTDKEFSRIYIKTAFDCEGSVWIEKAPKIRFGIWKQINIIQDGMKFIDEIKMMLNEFDITTTATWLTKPNLRKKGEITRGLYFNIRQQSLNKFSDEIGFSNRFKKGRLSLSSRLGYPQNGIV